MPPTSERICRKCGAIYFDEHGNSLGYCDSCRTQNCKKISATMLAGGLFVLLAGIAILCVSGLVDSVSTDSPLYFLGIFLWLAVGTSIIGPFLAFLVSTVWEKAQKGNRRHFNVEHNHQPGESNIKEWWVVIPAIWAFSMFYIMTNSLYSNNTIPSTPLFIGHALGLACLGIALLVFRKNRPLTVIASGLIFLNFIWLIKEVQRLAP